MYSAVSHVRVRHAGSTKKAQRQGPRPGIGRLDDGIGLGLLVASRRFSSIKECHKTLRKISEKTLSTKMKLQLFCVAAAALIQSAFVASHEVPSFRGVSLLDDAKDAAAVSLYLLGSICPRPTLTACYETLVHRSLPSSPPRPMLPKRKTSSLTRPRRRGKLRIYSWSLLLCTGS